MSEIQLDTLTASEAARDIREGRLSAETLLDACLARVARFNPSLNALVTLGEAGARAAAKAADRKCASGGDLPPLLGVPVSIKDAFETRGLRTTASFKPLTDYVPDRDATVVARLRAAGAVIVGKSNLSELAGAPHCWSPLFGLTRNPWNPALTPGGSSGGAAVAVAAGFSLLEAGSDLAGSIRIPAAYCGVSGFKATENRIPRTGHIPHLPEHLGGVRSVRRMLSFGALGRSVADLQLGLAVMAGPDGIDSEVPALPVAGASLHDDGRPLRLLLWDDWGLPLCERTRAVFARLPEKLSAAGHVLRRGSVAGIDPAELWEVFGLIAGAEIGLGMPGWQRHAFLVLRHLLPPSERLMRAISRGLRFDMRAYNRALDRREQWIQQLEAELADVDALLCPVVSTVAYPGQPLGPFDRPPRLTVAGKRLPYLEATIGLTVPFSLSGSPVVALPAGVEDGLPVGVQLVGRRWGDDALLAAAARLEPALGGLLMPPALR
jgi:amidase